MIISRTVFFALPGVALIALLTMPKIIWLAKSKKTTGIFYFESPGNPLDQIRSSYCFIHFQAGADSVEFMDRGNLGYHDGDRVSVRYNPRDPSDARLDIFISVWGATAIYGSFPVLLLLIFFFHPHIVPRKASFKIGLKPPFVQMLLPEDAGEHSPFEE